MPTYKLDGSASSTFGSVNLVGAQSFTINSTGDETTLGSDGKPFLQGSFIDNLSYTISVESSDAMKTIKIGDVGAVVLRAKERANGDGVATGSMTFTSAANTAVVTGIDNTVNHAGNSTYTLNLRVISADGSVDPITVA